MLGAAHHGAMRQARQAEQRGAQHQRGVHGVGTP
jgi:hypothetical protein